MKNILIAVLLSSSVSVFAESRTLSDGWVVEELHRAGDIIWGFDFVSPDEVIYTERAGKLFRYNLKSKTRTELLGVPKVWAKGQGGLLDLRVDPQDSSRIYFTYSDEVAGKGGATALGTAKLGDAKLVDVRRLFVSNTPTSSGQHFGSRIEFDSPTTLMITVGDRGERDFVQNPKSHNGKVIRLVRSGEVPSDNPYVGSSTHAPEVFTLGHRSPQGLARRVDGLLVLAEMGPRGGDEINILRAQKNYGWPVVTFGREYWGPRIGEGTSKPGLEAPVHQWTPSVSPSAIAWVENSEMFRSWAGQLLVACLSGKQLRRLKFETKGGTWSVVEDKGYLQELNARIRNIRFGPDGRLYLSTDGGVLLRASMTNEVKGP
jgi:glucose/arabinose dehydrogenase